VNTAKTRAVREKRTIPLSALWDPITADSFDSVVEPGRFLPADAPRWPGHWTSLPPGWGAEPEERLLSGETRSLINAAIDSLPPSQREVVTLRDSEGWTTEECVTSCRLPRLINVCCYTAVALGFGERWSSTSLEREPDLR
jgi:RNA polymerase sigma-70 factor (ECF subfamily)